MTRELKQNVAKTVPVGPFQDSSGAALPSITVASVDVTLIKDDMTIVDITPAASGSANDMAHIDEGFYSLELTASNLDTPGNMRAAFYVSGALIFMEDFVILPANVYDSKYGSDKLQVDVVSVEEADASDYFNRLGRGHSTVTYIGTGDNAKTLIEAASAGTLCVLAPGTHTVASTIAVPNGVSIVGAGVRSTILSYTGVANQAISPGTGSTVRNFMIVCTQPGGQCISILGSTGVAISNVLVEGMELVGRADGINVNRDVACSIYIRNCHIQSDWDGVRAQNAAHTVLLEDVTIDAVGNGSDARAIATSGPAVLIGRNVDLWATNGSSIINGIYADDTSTVRIHGVRIHTWGTSSSLYDVNQSESATVILTDSEFDRSKVNGAIVDIVSPLLAGDYTAPLSQQQVADAMRMDGFGAPDNDSIYAQTVAAYGAAGAAATSAGEASTAAQAVQAKLPSGGQAMAGATDLAAKASQTSVNALPSASTINTAIEAGAVGTDAAAARSAAEALPNAAAIAAAVSGETPPAEFFTNAPSGGDPSDWDTVKTAIADNLDAPVSGIVAGTTQPRQNKAAGPAFQLDLVSGADGTYKAIGRQNKAVCLRPGLIQGGGIAVQVFTERVFGSAHVVQVYAPTVSSGSIVATELGPRDSSAMVKLTGTVTAGETPTVTFDVLMETDERIPITFDINGFAT